jgi:RNA polymerase-binding protein DksA
MAKLTKKELEYFENLLKEKRKKIMDSLEYYRSTVVDNDTKEASGDAASYSFHMADQGTDAMEREKAFLFASRDEKYLKQLDDALERINNETYGICRSCKKLIGKERLEAVPTTTICYDCKVNAS